VVVSSDLKARISSVALDLLEQDGPDAVTMRKVASAVGITPMAIYHHFNSRETLLRQITDAEFDKLLDCINARGHRGTLRTQILHCMDGYLDYAFSRARVFDHVFCKPREGARRFPDDFSARQSPTLTPIADLVSRAMAEGQLMQDDPWEVALQLWSLTHGYITLYRAGRFHLDEQQFRDLVHRALKRMLDGLRAQEGATS
jgi:AcrR family transcriptional regulator